MTPLALDALDALDSTASVIGSTVIIPERTRKQRREAYALAIARVGINTGFHSAFAAGASQSRQRQH
jgi:hypothetical protein